MCACNATFVDAGGPGCVDCVGSALAGAVRVPFFGLLRCTRSSGDGDADFAGPCAGAVRLPVVRVEHSFVHGTDSPFAESKRLQWGRVGRNHRVENGEHLRDIDDYAWFVRIADIAAWEAFCLEHGAVIVSFDRRYVPACWSVEIYDTYRE